VSGQSVGPSEDEGARERSAPRRGRGRPAVGRAAPLTTDEVLSTAEGIVAAHGLAALSLRRLADELGVTMKAIYSYVPSKAALLDALVARVWERIAAEPSSTENAEEWIVQMLLRTRRVWLEHLDLATMAMAVAAVDEGFVVGTRVMADITLSAGFSDAGLAANVLQTYTMGSVAVAATRASSSELFGRDPDAVLAEAKRQLEAVDAPAHHRAVVVARFAEGDDEHFEHGLRLLVRALLAADPPA
jgi:TetR/AcrR family transcriptional regulator, tetracycline repressor protein